MVDTNSPFKVAVVPPTLDAPSACTVRSSCGTALMPAVKLLDTSAADKASEWTRTAAIEPFKLKLVWGGTTLKIPLKSVG